MHTFCYGIFALAMLVATQVSCSDSSTTETPTTGQGAGGTAGGGPGGGGSGGSGGSGGAGGSDLPTVWPNELSAASSDPWLSEHHQAIRLLRPRVLALNFVNARSNAEMVAQLEEFIDAVAESSRYHGDEDPAAPEALRYELAYTIDLTDADPPPGWPYNNSTLYPREDPVEGYWGFDYEALFTPEFAQHYGITDPADPGAVLTLCQAIDRGLVHEVWIYMDADVPDASAAEILELKPFYDASRQRLPGPLNPCAGNGCFDWEDEIPADCTRTVRIATFNNTRGPGCFLESHSHGFESMAAWNELQIPYLSTYFRPFAGYGLDHRYGVPADSWYACESSDCLTYPTATSVSYTLPGGSGTVDPYDPVCGNVHFAPNGRRHYDLESPFVVETTCRSYRSSAGEVAEPFDSSLFAGYQAIAGDCMGPFLVWWRQQFPGLDNDALDDTASPMLSWWPFLFY